jgi:RHS repeat-associated protein
MDGRIYTTSLQFDTANQVTQMTYPSNRAINIGHDSKGRVSSVGSYLSSVIYDGIGRLSGTTLGNGVAEGFGYDATRMQLTSQTATKNGGPTNGLMNLTYGYDAAAGQMGAGSTAGNAGQLMSISGTINQTPESAAYTYDDVGRLVTSNQTSNGSSAQRRFAYDRWGNRTGMWDAVSGGTQIQSIALQQSGGVPTNQIQSVTSGSTVNYAYDAAGNVTNDGAHSYSYDAEDRIISVDGGSTATYAYDQSNQRYKKVTGGATTHYIWQGSQVIAEHNGSSGASIADYVYSGSRMIAKAAGLTTQYFLNDRLSVRLILNTTGNSTGRQGHLPFGEDFGESGTQDKHHLTSYERDGESGIDNAVNRQYSQSIGRFNRPDPFTGSYSPSKPQSLNRYSYVTNDPIGSTDPSGLDSFAPGTSGPAGYPPGYWNPYDNIFDPYEDGWYMVITIPPIEINLPASPQQQTCPVQPLSPITDPTAQSFENGNTIDTQHLTEPMRAGLACFQTAVTNAGGSFSLTSAYRPPAYQQHLQEVWDKWHQLRDNHQPECAQTRQQVQAEFQRHGLQWRQGARPVNNSAHERGEAIDVSITNLPRGQDVDRLAGGCGLYRPSPQGDPVHFIHR